MLCGFFSCAIWRNPDESDRKKYLIQEEIRKNNINVQGLFPKLR